MAQPYTWLYDPQKQYFYYLYPISPTTPDPSVNRPWWCCKRTPRITPPVLPTSPPVNPVLPTPPPVKPIVVAPPPPPYTHTGWVPRRKEFQHPRLDALIDGEATTPGLYIDFADPDLKFRTHTRFGDQHLVTLIAHEIEQPATTSPSITRVQILCDAAIPQPIELQVLDTWLEPSRPQRAALPYLSLEDIVHAVHTSLHRKISDEELGSLSMSQWKEIASACTRRCKAPGGPVRRQKVTSKDARWVDFLLKNTWFIGFTWLEPENGVERLKLLLDDRPSD